MFWACVTWYEAITDRYKLRPLVDPKDEIDDVLAEELKSFNDYAS